jgi:hypothetical protein
VELKAFENRVLRKMFRPKRNEVKEQWRRLFEEELHDLYFSQNIIQVKKSRGNRWARHVALMGKVQVHRGFCEET